MEKKNVDYYIVTILKKVKNMKLIFDNFDIEAAKLDALKSIDFDSFPSFGYSIPMLISIAREFSDTIIDLMPRLSSADHISCFKCLTTLINEVLERNGDSRFEPYLQRPIKNNKILESSFNSYFSFLTNLNTIISINQRIWNFKLLKNGLYAEISPEHRRTALNIIGTKARFHSYSKEIQEMLQNQDIDIIKLSLAEKLDELNYIIKGIPHAWDKLLNQFQVSTNELISFKAFISYVFYQNVTWLNEDVLKSFWQDYIEKYEQTNLSDKTFHLLLELFTITLEEALNWGIAAPFLKINTKHFFFWPFFHHIIHPSLSMINLFHRKFNKEWNNSIGTEMAKISTFILTELKTYENIKTVSEKTRSGIGDIDIGLYDIPNKHLFIIEVKTVFDKFRTNYQYSNFAYQKVDFLKAVKQLNNIDNAIRLENWKLVEIFGDLDANCRIPKRITKIVLTWWDIVKVPETCCKDILSCNFDTFKYLYSKSKGNLNDLCNAISELSNLYCPYVIKESYYNFQGKQTKFLREIQADILPPKSNYNNKLSSKFAISELEDVAKFPNNWNKLREFDEWNFY